MKIKEVTKKVLPLLVIPFILTGCGRKSDCDIKEGHVHKYYLNTSIGTIYSYINSEKIKYNDDFIWTQDYFEITKDDEAFYRTKGNLFDGKKNWGYLYNGMSECHDYLEFYYHYTTEESYTDDDGDTHYETKHHSGWTDNPYHRGVTGEVALNHYRFYSYKIEYKNGKYVKTESPLVDDIRDVLDEYPYVHKYFAKTVYKSFMFNTSQLPYLKASDFNYFTGPDLSNKEPNKKVK